MHCVYDHHQHKGSLLRWDRGVGTTLHWVWNTVKDFWLATLLAVYTLLNHSYFSHSFATTTIALFHLILFHCSLFSCYLHSVHVYMYLHSVHVYLHSARVLAFCTCLLAFCTCTCILHMCTCILHVYLHRREQNLQVVHAARVQWVPTSQPHTTQIHDCLNKTDHSTFCAVPG